MAIFNLTVMSKRLCPFTEIQQAVKKQEIYGRKEREIRSTASEKALQLLYLGATKQVNSKAIKNINVCSQCEKAVEIEIKCFYCDTCICCECIESCTHCGHDYCNKCVFVLKDKSICYSCY